MDKLTGERTKRREEQMGKVTDTLAETRTLADEQINRLTDIHTS